MIAKSDLDYLGLPGERVERWTAYQNVERSLRDAGLSCRGAGELELGPVANPKSRRLATNALVFVTAGGGKYFDAQHPAGLAIRPPAVIWLFPGVAHAYGPGPNGWREHWVLFEGTSTRVFEGFDAWSRAKPVVRARAGEFEQIGSVFRELRRVLAEPTRRAQLLAATIVSYLVGIAIGATTPTPRRSAVSVVDAVRTSAFLTLSVAERAERLGLTSDAFRSAVREATGLSPHELVIEVRLARAQRLLAETTIEVSAVARQVGYDDPAYFSRLFRNRVGISPIRFRRQERPRHEDHPAAAERLRDPHVP